MSNEEIKKEEKELEKSKPKLKAKSRRVRKQKQLIAILVVLIGGVTVFQLQASLGKKEYIDDNVYTTLKFEEPIKQTLAIITFENNGNKKLFNNQNNKIEYSDIKNYKEENLDRYRAYHELHPDYLEAEVIWKVNANFDYLPYENVIKLENGDDTLVVINKNIALVDWYVPNNLVQLEGVSSSNLLVQSEVNESFSKMLEALKKADLPIDVEAAYKDYATLQSEYNALVNEKGQDIADKEGVRPGHSEDQLGLAIKVNDKSELKFSDTDTYQWLKNNAHRFGFIFRYDVSDDNTGYPKDSSHLRFVGKDVAVDMYEKNISVFEEYLDKYGA